MRILRALYWRLRIAWMAARWIPRLNLGDEVEVFDQGRGVLYQGVMAPIWKVALDSGENIETHAINLHKVLTPANLYRSFRSGWRFYMGYWYRIWLERGWRIPKGLRPSEPRR